MTPAFVGSSPTRAVIPIIKMKGGNKMISAFVGILIFAVMSWVLMILGQSSKQSPKFEATSVLVAASIISCTISFVSIWIALSMLKDNGLPNYDHQDIIVSIFSLLVTLLIGWNIYTVIDFKENVKKAYRIYYRNSARANEGLADVYMHLLGIGNEKEFKLLQYLIDAIKQRSKLGEYQKCNKLIDTFINLDINWDDFKQNLNNQRKEEIKEHLYDIDNTKEIESWPAFKKKMFDLTSLEIKV